MSLSRKLFAVSIVAVSACAAETGGSKSIDEVVCEDINLHLEDCVDVGFACDGESVDPAFADQILGRSCEDLQASLESVEEWNMETDAQLEEELARARFYLYVVKVGCAGFNSRGVRVERVRGTSNSNTTSMESLIAETKAVCVAELRANGVVGPTTSWVITARKVPVEVR